MKVSEFKTGVESDYKYLLITLSPIKDLINEDIIGYDSNMCAGNNSQFRSRGSFDKVRDAAKQRMDEVNNIVFVDESRKTICFYVENDANFGSYADLVEGFKKVQIADKKKIERIVEKSFTYSNKMIRDDLKDRTCCVVS